MMRVLAPTTQELYAMAGETLLAGIERALRARGTCVIGLVGGRSMPALLESLLSRLHGKRLEGSVHVFWLDERVDPDKNFTPVLPLLERLQAHMDLAWHPLVSTQRAAMEAEIASCGDALARLGGTFDVAVLSAGEDGHVASLFPRNPALHARERRYVFVEDAPKPPPLRVSVSPPLLLAAHETLLLFAGAGKRDAYRRFCDQGTPVEECPAKLLEGARALRVLVCVDD